MVGGERGKGRGDEGLLGGIFGGVNKGGRGVGGVIMVGILMRMLEVRRI